MGRVTGVPQGESGWQEHLPREAHTDLPVAASNMGCFLAILTLM